MAKQPADFSQLPHVDMAPPRDIYYDFMRAKNYIFNEYSLLDSIRFFDVIAKSNAKFWQSIGEQCPVDSPIGLPGSVVAQMTLERIYKEPSLVKFIELIQELKNHVAYTSNLPAMQNSGASEAELDKVIINEVVVAFDKFKIAYLINMGDSGNISSGLVENDKIIHSSQHLMRSFHSDILDQYISITRQQERKRSRSWKRSRISATLKFPFFDIGSEWERLK